MKRLIIVSLLILVTATLTSAQVPGYIAVFSDAEGMDCNIVDTGGIVDVHILHIRHDGATASQFMLDVSATGWVYAGDSWNHMAIGSSITGVGISYGGCMTAPTYLGKVTFVGSSAPPCTEIHILPDPNCMYGEILACDCTETIMYPSSFTGIVNCGPCGVKPPGNMLPADETIDVSVNPTLAWTWEAPTGCPEGIGMTVYTVYLGTDPDNLPQAGSIVTGGTDTNLQMTVGPLQTNTLYYWCIKVRDDYWSCPGSHIAFSPTQSFTTGSDVPAEQTSWGRIKSLFR